MYWKVYSILVLVVYSLGPADCGYLITTPRRWTKNFNSQICAALTEGTFTDADYLKYSLTEKEQKAVLKQDAEIKFAAGESESCIEVIVPPSEDGKITLNITGSLANQPVSELFNLTFVERGSRTFIQTDKFLYRQGQTVQFRILTVKGPDYKVDTENYGEVYVKDPTRTQIAQWLNVDNSAGLVHLSFDLFGESDEGTYTVGVKFPDGRVEEKVFRVEDYVLPKYEITIEAPKNILGSDKSVTVKLCARYTFGEPVSGNASLSLAGGSYRTYANLTENKTINGCEEFTFPTDELLFDQNNCHIRISSLKARALVAESDTGVELFGSNDLITVNRRAVKFLDQSPAFTKKPYMPYNVKIAAQYADDSPAANEPMSVCTRYLEENVCKNFTTNQQGLLSFVLPSSADSRVEVKAVNYPKIERNWNDVMSESKYYKYFYSSQTYHDATNSSLTIFMDDKLECITGQDIGFNVPIIYIAKSQPSVDVRVQIISHGQVVTNKKFAVGFTGSELPFTNDEQLLPLEKLPEGVTRGIFNIPVTLPASVSPRVKILVWFHNPDGGVVADLRDVEVTKCLKHKVDFKFSTDKAEPGTEANFILNGANDALCSIGVVDKSVELLSTQNSALNIPAILQLAYKSDVARWDPDQLNLGYCHRKYNATVLSGLDLESNSQSGDLIHPRFHNFGRNRDAFKTFVDAGYYVSSNLDLDIEYCNNMFIQELKRESTLGDFPPPLLGSAPPRPVANVVGGIGLRTKARPRPQAFAAPALESAALDSAGFSDREESVEEPQERSYLPETWLWLLKPLSSTGELNEAVKLPDAITEWVGKAVCIHPTEGVGISDTASVTTFTPFFVDLTLPPSGTRTEILPVKISVFNYLNEDLPVKVSIEPSADYEFVGAESGIREICIPAQTKMVETIKVNMTTIGHTNLIIDAVTQPLSTGSCGSGNPPAKKDRLIKSLPVEAEGYVREKTWSKYVCSQDLENTEGPVDTWRIEAPAGVVEDSERSWITAVGDLMGPTIENLGNLVQLPSGCGEQNMVNFAPNVYIMQYLEASVQNTEVLRSKLTKFLNHGYQRQLRFKHGNHSYSAFGTKDLQGSTWLTAFVVKSLAQAIPYTQIDTESLIKSADWLKRLQKENGCFESRGRLINKKLQGGLKSSGDTEALLTAYVLAALLEQGNVTDKIVSGAIKCIESDTSEHPYSLALKGYSLALAKVSSASGVLKKLLQVAVTNSSDMRWNLPDREGENTALHVETAAYAILGLAKYDSNLHSQDLRKIIRWLSGQRNGQGGFKSTQDTVVALQALAAFEKSQSKDPMNLVIKAASTDLSHSFTVTDDNKFLQQRVVVPTLPSSVDLTVTGEGCALIQGVLRYNVLGDSTGDAFALNVDVKPSPEKGCKTKRISACTTYNLADGASNMAIIEVKLVSGYIPLKQDLKEVIARGGKNFKRYEVNGPKVFFYLDEINAKEICASFRVYQEVEIENAKPGSVTVYDYYQPEYITTQKYTIDNQKCV